MAKKAATRPRVRLVTQRILTVTASFVGGNAATAFCGVVIGDVELMNPGTVIKERDDNWREICVRTFADVSAGSSCRNAKDATVKDVTTAENRPASIVL